MNILPRSSPILSHLRLSKTTLLCVLLLLFGFVTTGASSAPSLDTQVVPSSVPCERSPLLATTLFGTRLAERDQQGYYTFQQEVESRRNDNRTRLIEVKVHQSLVDRKVLPVNVCPLTRSGKGFCAGRFQFGDGIAVKELHSAAGPKSTEMFRLEVVDFGVWDVNPEEPINSQIPAEALVSRFKEAPIEIWIEYYDADTKAVKAAGGTVSPLGRAFPRVGFWTCHNGHFAWKNFSDIETVEKDGKSFFRVRSNGWNDPAVGMQP